MELPVKALSIRQPWAWAILNAGKDIENRDWPTRFVGPVCIHAAKGMTRDEYEDCLATAHDISLTHPFPHGLTMPAFDELSRGGIVGTARTEGCVSRSTSPWFFGKYGFVIRDARPCEFIPVNGELGFFEWRKNIITPQPAKQHAQGALF